MPKLWFVAFAVLVGMNQAHASSNTCKKEGGYWWVYCGDVRASENGAIDAPQCFRTLKDICPTESTKSTVTCK